MFKTRHWIVLASVAVFLISATIYSGLSKAVVSSQLQDRHIFIIDAGHGGEDGGASSCMGVPESRLNLQIALRLEQLMRLLGWQTKMIRTEDISVYTQGTTLSQKKVSDLKERVRIVNSEESAVLISIHQNHYPDGRYCGAQVFYAPTGGSKVLAEAVQNAFTSTVNPNSNRRIKAADGIYLMQNVHCPAILIECGFLSNINEEGLLRSDAYQKKICAVIASSVTSSLKDLMLT